jgi:hypothetical protein
MAVGIDVVERAVVLGPLIAVIAPELANRRRYREREWRGIGEQRPRSRGFLSLDGTKGGRKSGRRNPGTKADIAGPYTH